MKEYNNFKGPKIKINTDKYGIKEICYLVKKFIKNNNSNVLPKKQFF
jgi:hypothetical protein